MSQICVQTLKQRKEEERQGELRIQLALSSRKKALERSKREKRQKKKSVGELLCHLNYCGIQAWTLRSGHTYLPKSSNLDRQLTGLLNHMFVRYPVPVFMYQACIKSTGDPFECMHEMYRQWFVAIAQGGSLSKLVK